MNMSLFFCRVCVCLVICSGQFQIIGNGLMDMVLNLALLQLIVPITLRVILVHHIIYFPR
ncbi:hypothetical protein B296_00009870 [Ensete ventricosum]|uniref:Uncharacterized protein n=1 Tax=Ensete ventricosum TaxID=4639 RepID=A0A427AT42_ENSVE|nr:hypothetical protein B296_00009870 [Ensete ventricosum]